MKPLLEAHEKKIRAVQLFADGHSYGEIARELGFTSRGSAYRCVTSGLSFGANPEVNDLRQRAFDELDGILNAHWHRAVSGDIAASMICLEVSRQRLRWLGKPRG